MSKSVFEELNSMFSTQNVSVRGENAWAVAVKFLSLLQEQVPDEDEQKKLMFTWMRAVKDNDFKKFERALRRYQRKLDKG